MKRIRIGKDFAIHWSVYRMADGQRLPLALEGKDLDLFLIDPYSRKFRLEDWEIQNNTIKWVFRGLSQKYVGSYRLLLVVNNGKDGMVTVDTCRAFELVSQSCAESSDSGGDYLDDISVVSIIALAPLDRGTPLSDKEIDAICEAVFPGSTVKEDAEYYYYSDAGIGSWDELPAVEDTPVSEEGGV